jgi:hypothetical protein
MEWNYIPAEGTAGGILVGFKALTFEVISWQNFKFGATAIVRNHADKFTWRLIVVYGSPYEEFKLGFISELDSIMTTWQGPTILGGGGGDFNLVRHRRRKATIKLIYLILMLLMNGLISGS